MATYEEGTMKSFEKAKAKARIEMDELLRRVEKLSKEIKSLDELIDHYRLLLIEEIYRQNKEALRGVGA